MSRPQEPHRPSLPFTNPLRMIFPKNSHLSPKLLALLKAFEETLSQRLRNLKPSSKDQILTLPWMNSAMQSLSTIHTDIKTLITSLELPVSDWDDKWIDVYLDNSVKLLDICIAFSSEISRLNQGHLFLQCVLHKLGAAEPKELSRARSSLDGWKDHVGSKNPRLENCFSIMDNLAQTLDLPKIKNSAKGKVLMRAMYGVRAATVFICSVFAAAFSGSSKKLMDLQIPENFSWGPAYTELQAFVNTEIRNVYSNGRLTVLKELEAVDVSVKKLDAVLNSAADPEALESLMSDLGTCANGLSQGLDSLAKEVDGFFQIVLSGRDALLGNLRLGGVVSSNPVTEANNKVESVR